MPPRKVEDKPKGVSYSAPADTEVSTTVGGKNVRVQFEGSGKRSTFTTVDPDLIAILDSCATAEHHPIGFDPKED